MSIVPPTRKNSTAKITKVMISGESAGLPGADGPIDKGHAGPRLMVA